MRPTSRRSGARLYLQGAYLVLHDPEKCQACSTCLKKCPAQAIEGGKKQIHVIDQEKMHQVRHLL